MSWTRDLGKLVLPTNISQSKGQDYASSSPTTRRLTYRNAVARRSGRAKRGISFHFTARSRQYIASLCSCHWHQQRCGNLHLLLRTVYPKDGPPFYPKDGSSIRGISRCRPARHGQGVMPLHVCARGGFAPLFLQLIPFHWGSSTTIPRKTASPLLMKHYLKISIATPTSNRGTMSQWSCELQRSLLRIM